jgi:hypothetical protein
MPDRHDNHLINVFFFNELTKSPAESALLLLISDQKLSVMRFFRS